MGIMLVFIDLIGENKNDLEWYQMLVRAFIVFFAALVFIRLSGMRTFGTRSAFDIVVYITLGGMLVLCIVGHYPFYSVLLAAAFLVLLHRLVSFISARSSFINRLTEGDSVLLYEHGKKKTAVLKRYDIHEKELMMALHEHGVETLDEVTAIRLEPNGKISITKKSSG